MKNEIKTERPCFYFYPEQIASGIIPVKEISKKEVARKYGVGVLDILAITFRNYVEEKIKRDELIKRLCSKRIQSK